MENKEHNTDENTKKKINTRIFIFACMLFLVIAIPVSLTVYTYATTNDITFDANGGTGEMENQTLHKKEETMLSKNQFTRTGYDYKGWSTSQKGKVKYKDETKVTNISDEHDITLYAVWEAKKYDIIFDANGGKGKMENQMLTYDKKEPLRPNEFTKTGYTFNSWEAESIGEVFDDQESVKNLTAGKNIVFKASWIANKYKIKYDANGGEGEVAPQDAVYDQNIDLRNNSFTYKGHSFCGWSTEPLDPEEYVEGQTEVSCDIYKSGEYVKNLSSKDDITLYAVWESEVHAKREKMIRWCLGIVEDGTYKYGHGYCHLCNEKNPKIYDCTAFLRASLAHGVGDERWLKCCAGKGKRHGFPPDFCDYLTKTGWKKIGTDKECEPQRGDIIAYTRGGRYKHVSLYLGDGMIVHSSSSIGRPGVVKYYYGGTSRTIYRMME